MKDEIRHLANSNGFELVGFTKAQLSFEDKKNLALWVEGNYFGEMKWFPKQQKLRTEFENLGLKVNSVIVLGCIYNPIEYAKIFQNTKYKISRYAVGEDYHKVLKNKAKPLMEF